MGVAVQSPLSSDVRRALGRFAIIIGLVSGAAIIGWRAEDSGHRGSKSPCGKEAEIAVSAAEHAATGAASKPAATAGAQASFASSGGRSAASDSVVGCGSSCCDREAAAVASGRASGGSGSRGKATPAGRSTIAAAGAAATGATASLAGGIGAASAPTATQGFGQGWAFARSCKSTVSHIVATDLRHAA